MILLDKKYKRKMIIDEKILVKNSNYYKKLGYISDEKYITIATNSTAGCKLWSHPSGWT